MKVLWLTDPHLDRVSLEDKKRLYRSIQEEKPDMLLITGDVSDGVTDLYLKSLAKVVGCPIAFVLGNHDYYDVKGGVNTTIQRIRETCKKYTNLLFLDDCDTIIMPDGETSLVGVSNFADGKSGTFYTSPLVTGGERFADFEHIEDFRQVVINTRHHAEALKAKMYEFSKTATEKLLRKIVRASLLTKRVLVAVHVPPFATSCWHQGKPGHHNYLPFFCDSTMGNMLANFAISNGKILLSVFCGHTHEPRRSRIYDNLQCMVGRGEYGAAHFTPIML